VRSSTRFAAYLTCLLLAGCGTTSTDTAPVELLSDVVVAAPLLVLPPDSAVLSNFPRDTYLVWHPVAGAATYALDVDCYDCCVGNRWCSDVGQPVGPYAAFADTTYTHRFVGAQPGRWRAWGVDAAGRRGPKSEWRYFRYTI
jgi:hypothetical protein